MENYSKQSGEDKASVQWHTLSENLMELGSENREPPGVECDSSLSQGRVLLPDEKNTANHPTPPVQPEPVKTKKMPPVKKKTPIWAIAAAIIAIMAAGSALLFYFTVHWWTEPTCTEASVCTICGKTGNPAAGHQWTPASCTEPKICNVCHEAEGVSLGHDLRNALSHDFIKCTTESWTECSRCDYCTSRKSEQLTSFLDEGTECFLMSPNAFKERVEYLASIFDPEQCIYGDLLPFDDMKNVTFRWFYDDTSGSQGSTAIGLPVLECYSGSECLLMVQLYDLSADGVSEVDRDCPSSFNSIVMSETSSSKKAESVYYSMETILVAACDPEIDLNGTSVFVLAAKANSGGKIEQNGLIYGASDMDYNIVTRKMLDKIIGQNF